MKVVWEVDDFYCGGARPQHTEVPDDDICECTTADEVKELVESYIQEDFSRMSFYVTNMDEALGVWGECKEKKG